LAKEHVKRIRAEDRARRAGHKPKDKAAELSFIASAMKSLSQLDGRQCTAYRGVMAYLGRLQETWAAVRDPVADP
jgi:hypothetical protein